MDPQKTREALEFNSLCKKIKKILIDNNAIDASRISSDTEYRQFTDQFTLKLAKEAESSISPASWPSNSEPLNNFINIALADFNHSQTFSNTSLFYEINNGFNELAAPGHSFNRGQVNSLQKKISTVIKENPNHPLSDHIQKFLPFLLDRSFIIIVLYTFGLAITAPITGFIGAKIYTSIDASLLESPDGQELFKMVLSFVMFLPLVFVNKVIKTIRRPTVYVVLLPILVALAIAVYFEYSFSWYYFLDGNLSPVDIGLFVRNYFANLTEKALSEWLYPAPFVAIYLTLLRHTAIIPPLVPQFISESWDELAGWIEKIIISIIAIVLSGIIKVGLLLS